MKGVAGSYWGVKDGGKEPSSATFPHLVLRTEETGPNQFEAKMKKPMSFGEILLLA